MKKTPLILAAFLTLAGAAEAQPGPTPTPWVSNGATISYSIGGILAPSTVTGGTQGAGTINVSNGYYVGGNLVPPSVFGRYGAISAQSGDYSFSLISGTLNLETQVAGTLPGGNGGTNSAYTAFAGPASTIKTFTLPNASANVLTDATASFTSAQLAGALTNETGSGPAVFGTAPSVSALTVTGSLTATGLVTNGDLANPATTVNGQTCTLGSTCTITSASASIAVGTTTISGGTSGRVEYNNAGTLGEMTTSGSGTQLALTTSPTIASPTVTGAFTATGLVTNADLANSTISGVALGANLGTLTFGSHLTSGGSSYNGSAGVTITSDATSANTASTIVSRDASGNFSAGTVTASLTGRASLDLPLTGGTLTGELVTAASATGGAGLNIPPGAAPTSPVNGDCWTTSSGLFCRINGATVGPFIQASGAPVTSVASSDGTLTVSPTTGAVAAGIALGHVNTWTGAQTFANNGIAILGSSTGKTTFSSANTGSTNFTMTVPDATDTLAVLGTAQTFTAPKTFNSGDLIATSAILTTPDVGAATGTSLALAGCTLGTDKFCVTGGVNSTSTIVAAAGISGLSFTQSGTQTGAIIAGAHGATNPAFQVSTGNTTASTGVKITASGAGSGVAISTQSSGTNENISIDAKGSGVVAIAGTSTGGASVAGGLTVTGSFTATGLVTNGDLVNQATTVNGVSCVLGSTCSITAAATSIAPGTTTILGGTSGNIEYNNAGTLGELATLGVAHGGTGVAVQPAFRATNSTSQSISPSTYTKVTLGTVSFDTNGNFASSRFTPTVAGYYEINARIAAQDSVAITTAVIALYKNGAEYSRGNFLGSGTGANAGLVVSDIVYFNGSTDYVELYGYIAGTAPLFLYNSTTDNTYMSGSFLHQ